ncbi:MAG: tetratricopeptide repeat protein, partial [Holophagales bacterium]|nr:tetratricopeptide repeat protein [Holophagales bacterium]
MRPIAACILGLLPALAGCQDSGTAGKTTEEHLLDTIRSTHEGTDHSASMRRRCLDAFHQAQALGFARAEAQALYCVATSERDLNRYDSAWRRVEQGLHYFEAIGDSERIYEGLRLQASILQLWGLQDRAAEHYLRMLRLAGPPGTIKVDAAMLNNYAAIEFRRGNYKLCLELSERAAEISDPENLRLRLAIALNQGEALFHLRHYDRALAQIESVRPELERLDTSRFLAIHSRIRGQILAALERPDEALQALGDGLNLVL